MPNRGLFTTYELTKGDEILAFIHAKYASNITIEDLRDHTNLNEKMLQRLVRKRTGSSIHQYQEQYRFSKVIEELSGPDGVELKIGALARKHGYRSDKYFYRIFKKRMGLTPEEYRAKIQSMLRHSISR